MSSCMETEDPQRGFTSSPHYHSLETTKSEETTESGRSGIPSRHRTASWLQALLCRGGVEAGAFSLGPHSSRWQTLCYNHMAGKPRATTSESGRRRTGLEESQLLLSAWWTQHDLS